MLWACVGDDPFISGSNNDGGPSSAGDASTTDDALGNGDGGGDAALTPSGPCDPTKPFLAPELVPDLNDSDGAPTIAVRLSFDGLSAFFSRGTVAGDQDLFRATRADTNAPFGSAVPLPFVNGSTIDSKPSVTQDLNTLYYYKNRGGALSDIFRATRTSNGYETLKLLGAPVNVDAGAQDPFVSLDGSQLFFTTQRDGANKPEIWVATEPNDDGFFNARRISSIDAAGLAYVDTPVLSRDMLTLYFGGGTLPDTGVWVIRRTSLTEAFGAPEKLQGAPELDMPGQRDEPSFITPDDCTLYMYSNRSGPFQTYRANRSRE